MRRIDHPLEHQSLGRQTQVTSLHFGQPGAGPKAYVQASLHAEELPGMLAAYHLRALLEAAESRGDMRGEVVLVPVANPIGLAQRLDHKSMGRFELGSSENFNRNYPDLATAVFDTVKDRLTQDATANVAAVRAAVAAWLAQWKPANALHSLRKTLVQLAFDADIVLDLHCDCEAVLHLYTETPCWPQLEPLARLLGARASLLADESGDDPYDEACSTVWRRLNGHLRERSPDATLLPDACVAVTVELRGEADVSHDLAASDARALVDYLVLEGFINMPVPELPPLLAGATPLAGSLPVVALVSGVLVFVRAPGDLLRRGEHVADVIDPLSGSVTALTSPADGLMYARESTRTVQAGMTVAKVAGSEAVRAGRLLSA